MTKTTKVETKNEEVTYNNLDDLLEGGIRVGQILSFVATDNNGKSKLAEYVKVKDND